MSALFAFELHWKCFAWNLINEYSIPTKMLIQNFCDNQVKFLPKFEQKAMKIFHETMIKKISLL